MAKPQSDFQCLVNGCLRSWEVNDIQKLMAFYFNDHSLLATKIFEYVTQILDSVRWFIVAGKKISSRTVDPHCDIGFAANYRTLFVLALKGSYNINRNL